MSAEFYKAIIAALGQTPLAVYAIVTTLIIKELFNRLIAEKELRITEKEQRITDLRAHAKEQNDEKELRIKDAQFYTKVHNEATREAYKYADRFEELTDIIIKRDQLAEQKEREELAQRERDVQNQWHQLQKTTGPHRPGSNPFLASPTPVGPPRRRTRNDDDG